MTVRIDPRIPHVWRSPQQLQFGVDEPLVRLEQVSNAEERVISAMLAGVPQEALGLLAERAGATRRQLAHLLDVLGPVLQGPPEGSAVAPTATAPTAASRRAHGRDGADFAVHGKGATAEAIARILAMTGTRVARDAADDAGGTRVRLAVLVADFVVDPAVAAYWLRRDVPHLPVVFGDTGAVVGPLVLPGKGPCLRCLDLYRTEDDAAWPAIAAQLLGREAPVHSGAFDLDVALRAVTTIRGERAEPRGREPRAVSPTLSIRIEAGSGEISARRHRQHPRCGCRALPENATAAAPIAAGSRSPTHGAVSSPTSSAAASAAPG